jgi:hypothetical protein
VVADKLPAADQLLVGCGAGKLTWNWNLAVEAAARIDGAGGRLPGGGTKQPNTEAAKRCRRPLRRWAFGKAILLQQQQRGGATHMLRNNSSSSNNSGAEARQRQSTGNTSRLPPLCSCSRRTPARLVHFAVHRPLLAAHEHWAQQAL